MTFDLTWHDSTHINLPRAMWVSMLKLASSKGWEPAGTEVPDGWDGEWKGTYMANAGQRVTDTDAGNLADALGSALPDVPDHDAMADKVVERKLPDGRVFRGVPQGVTFTPYEVWSGKSREDLVKLIGLCRKSGFTIT